MALKTVSYLLFTSEAFWENTEVKGLGILQRTCHQFRNEIQEGQILEDESGKKSKKAAKKLDAENGKTLLANAIHAIISSKDRLEQTLTVQEAMRRFALTLPAVLKHLRSLPEDHPFFLDKTKFLGRYYKETVQIPFLDAFKMAMERKGGLETVKNLKEKAATIKKIKTEEMAKASQALTEDVEKGCKLMMEVVLGTIAEIKKNQGAKKFKNRILILESIAQEIGWLEDRVQWVRRVLESPVHKTNILAIKDSTRPLHNRCVCLVRRFISNKCITGILSYEERRTLTHLQRKQPLFSSH